MAVRQLPSDQLSTAEQLKTTANLRQEIHDDIAKLQAAIKVANDTITRARLTIVQLSLHEDSCYASDAEIAGPGAPAADADDSLRALSKVP
jgi:hypothetical protein